MTITILFRLLVSELNDRSDSKTIPTMYKDLIVYQRNKLSKEIYVAVLCDVSSPRIYNQISLSLSKLHSL